MKHLTLPRFWLYKVPYGGKDTPRVITGVEAGEALKEVGLVEGQDETIDFVLELLGRDRLLSTPH